MQDIVAMVKEKTGINIEFNIIPKADTGEVDKRLVSLQAGDALDIVYGTVAQLKVFYDAGVLEPLDEMASAAGYDIKSVFGDSAPVYDDGQTYGLPAFTDVWCTFINSKVFENAGVEIPSAEGWTWEKDIETVQKLTNLDEEIYGSLMLDYVVNTAFVKYETSYAAAQALVMFAIVMVITLIQWRGQKKWADQ